MLQRLLVIVSNCNMPQSFGVTSNQANIEVAGAPWQQLHAGNGADLLLEATYSLRRVCRNCPSSQATCHGIRNGIHIKILHRTERSLPQQGEGC